MDDQKFFMLDEGTEDFYQFPDDWDEDEDEAAAEGVPIEDIPDLKRIIIIDRTTFHRNILRPHIEEAGFKVVADVGSAIDARDILTESKVRFAVVDIDATDGGEAKAIQLLAATHPQTVMVIASSRFTPDQVTRAEKAGQFFLSKPFQKPKVIDLIQRLYQAELAKRKSTPTPTNPKGASK